MVNGFALTRRAIAIASAASLVVAAIAPLLLGQLKVEAAQMTERQIRMTSSKVSETNVTYNVSFIPETVTGSGTDDIQGIVIDFCQNSPLAGTVCDKTRGVTAVPVTGTVSVTHNTHNGGTAVAFNAVAGGTAQAGRLLLTHATGLTDVSKTAAGQLKYVTFSFTVSNPTGTTTAAGEPGTFYARIVTFNDDTVANAYNSSATGANNPGTHLDDGGVALSTADQLTINARVQEQLEFCVASIPDTIVSNATTPANCQDAVFTGAGNDNTVDLGVIDSSGPSISPVSTTTGGDTQNGGIMIRTNAFYGAVVSYYAEQNSGSGRLKVPGASCNSTGAGAFDTGSNSVDQCFNSNGTKTAFNTAGMEAFGMTISDVYRPTGSTTTNLTRTADYTGTATAADGFAWVSTAPAANVPATAIATSSTVLDYEMLILRFAARSAPTTPTGSYAVTSTYIATSTF